MVSGQGVRLGQLAHVHSRNERPLPRDRARSGRLRLTPKPRPISNSRFMDSWVDQIIALMDGLGIEKAHIVGNSFGGSLALWLASRHPERFDRLVLMGPGGWPVRVNENLELLWDFKPTAEHMKRAMGVMAWNQALITDELAGDAARRPVRGRARSIASTSCFPRRASAGSMRSVCLSMCCRPSPMKRCSSTGAMIGWSIRKFRGTCTSICPIAAPYHCQVRALDDDRAWAPVPAGWWRITAPAERLARPRRGSPQALAGQYFKFKISKGEHARSRRTRGGL